MKANNKAETPHLLCILVLNPPPRFLFEDWGPSETNIPSHHHPHYAI